MNSLYNTLSGSIFTSKSPTSLSLRLLRTDSIEFRSQLFCVFTILDSFYTKNVFISMKMQAAQSARKSKDFNVFFFQKPIRKCLFWLHDTLRFLCFFDIGPFSLSFSLTYHLHFPTPCPIFPSPHSRSLRNSDESPYPLSFRYLSDATRLTTLRPSFNNS